MLPVSKNVLRAMAWIGTIVLCVLTFPLPEAFAQSEAIRISPDDPASLERGILAASKAGQKRVVIPAGVYRLPRREGDAFLLRLEDLKDFTIEATGVTLLASDRDKRSLLVNYCDDLTIQGLTIVRDTPPFSQGKIIAIAGDRASVDIRIDAGYPTDLDDVRYFPRIPVIDLFRKGTRQLKPLVPDLYIASVHRLAPDAFRFHMRSPIDPRIPVEIGDPAAWRGPSGSDISTWCSSHVQYRNVTLKNATGLAFFELGGAGGHVYDGCSVTYAEPPSGATDQPLLACGTDGFHSSGARQGPTIQNCTLEGLDDDMVNIHGIYVMLMEAHGRQVVLDIRPFHTGAREPIPFARPGDRIKFYNHACALTAEAKAVTLEHLTGYQAPDVKTESRTFSHRENADYWRLTLDQDVSGEAGDFVANADTCGGGFVIQNNTFRNNRAHGLFIRASDGIVENNTIEGTAMGAIVVAPEMLSWAEADYAQHLVIRGNTIRNASTASQPWNSGITVAAFERGFAPLPGGHRDIVIENNTIENGRNANLVLTSTVGAIIRNNRFVRPMTEPPFRVDKFGVTNDGAVIYLRQADKVTLENNVIVTPGAFFNTPVDSDQTVNAKGISEGVKIEAKPLPATTQPYLPISLPARFPMRSGLPTLWLIGDSTVRCADDRPNGMWGWGTPLAYHFDLSRINVQNLAVGGTSTRTFRRYGFWKPILDRMKAGDILVMQFGHNDASRVNDNSRARGTLPGLGDESTDIDNQLTGQRETVHTYGWYLRQYIAEARTAGVTDIFICSPLPKNAWIDGHVDRKWNANYIQWAQQQATQANAHFIPLNASVSQRYESLGPEKVTAELYPPREVVHTSWQGAVINAECVAQSLRDADVPVLKRAILERPSNLSVPPGPVSAR